MLRMIIFIYKFVDTGDTFLGQVLQRDNLALGGEDARLIARLQSDGYRGCVFVAFLIIGWHK